MWGKGSPTNNTETDSTAQTAKKSGAGMLLKSLGFDPEEFMSGIQSARAEYEAAKTASVQVVQHFNARLDMDAQIQAQQIQATQKVEKRIDALEYGFLQRFDRLEVMLRLVLSGLEVTEQPNQTQPNELTCEACGNSFESPAEFQDHSETCTGG
jgi:uncharacterized protein Yka (UPF0111/DUF47 family)